MSRPQKLHNYAPETDTFLSEVLTGLRNPVKQIPSKYFYDEEGSRLFEEITGLEEYYPTRTETEIMRRNIDDLVARVGDNAMLVEYGSGNSEKTEILLEHLHNLAAYVPIDISTEHLEASANRIAKRFPGIEVIPVAADYSDPDSFRIPGASRPASHRVVFYPGSTIGNFHPPEAVDFLAQMRTVCAPNGGIILGVDLRKDPAILQAAYNDLAGVTAAFNKNLLERINRELGADFDLDKWRHRAVFNGEASRIEMHLVSLGKQTVTIAGERIDFESGETIWTESSYKYTLARFEKLAAQARLRVARVWTDERELFSVQYLRLEG